MKMTDSDSERKKTEDPVTELSGPHGTHLPSIHINSTAVKLCVPYLFSVALYVT